MPLPLLGAGAIMVAARAALMGVVAAVIAKLPEIFVKVMAGLGLYFLVAKPAAGALRDVVANAFGAVNGTVLETLYYLNVDDYALAIISAHAISRAGRLILSKRAAS